jgi:5-methylcytosine-specific restriction endonuclease McrA
MTFKNNDEFEGVLLETCLDKGISRPRVRPFKSSVFPEDIRVEFPRNLREENPIGTRFIADLKVLQKTNKGTGGLIGAPYLRVNTKTIQIDTSFIPESQVIAIRQNTKSDRVYTYNLDDKVSNLSFFELRSKLVNKLNDKPLSFSISTQKAFDRSRLIVTYALSRANGICEGCEQQAPFLRKNGDPYLEVHHIAEVSNGGSDSPVNVIALCPNCHRRVTHGQDKAEYNYQLETKIIILEEAFDNSL